MTNLPAILASLISARNQNVRPYMTPGWNGAANPMSLPMPGQQAQATQAPGPVPAGGQPSASGQQGLLSRIASNPQIVQALTQLALSQGKYGGYRGAGFQNQVTQNNAQALERQIAEWNQQRDAERNSIDREQVATQRKHYEAQLEDQRADREERSRNQKAASYEKAEDNLRQSLAMIDPGTPEALSAAESEANYHADLLGLDDAQRAKLVKRSQLLVKGMKIKTAQKEKGLSETKDEDILAAGAARIGKPVEALTPAERAEIRKQHDIEIAGAKAQSYPGNEMPTYDASGKLTGLLNRQTMVWRPMSGQMPPVYSGGSPSLPGTTMERIEGMKTALDLARPVAAKLTSKRSFGPVAGRMTLAEINKLGGAGASKEDIALATELHRLVTTQAFANGGKQLTPTELEQFERLNPALSDTLDQAIIKTQQSIQFLQMRLKNTVDTLTPRQRELVNPNLVNTGPDQQPGQPKVGDTKQFPNGRKAQWDGKGWKAIQ